MGDETWFFACDHETKDRVLNGLVRHPSAEETEIPKVPLQEHVDIFRLSKRSAQRIRTRWKNSKCGIL